jgi:hypothetical protein
MVRYRGHQGVIHAGDYLLSIISPTNHAHGNIGTHQLTHVQLGPESLVESEKTLSDIASV